MGFKTIDALAVAISDLVGLTVAISQDSFGANKLLALSPNGTLIASITVGHRKSDGWFFGGLSMAFPDHWMSLCSLDRGSESSDDGDGVL